MVKQQRIYFEWMGMLWKLTPANLLRWIKDVQAGKDVDIGEYGPRYRAKKLPSGVYQYKGEEHYNPPSSAYPPEVCMLNMSDWEDPDLKVIRKGVEEYMAGKRKYINSHRCR